MTFAPPLMLKPIATPPPASPLNTILPRAGHGDRLVIALVAEIRVNGQGPTRSDGHAAEVATRPPKSPAAGANCHIRSCSRHVNATTERPCLARGLGDGEITLNVGDLEDASKKSTGADSDAETASGWDARAVEEQEISCARHRVSTDEPAALREVALFNLVSACAEPDSEMSAAAGRKRRPKKSGRNFMGFGLGHVLRLRGNSRDLKHPDRMN